MRWLGILLFALPCTTFDVDPFDQSHVPLEVDSPDPKLAKVVLVAGRVSHGPGEHEFFAGTALLMKMLKQTPGVWPVMARDGWPRNEGIFKDAKAVVFYMDGRAGHEIIKQNRMELVQRLIDAKAGFVNLHYAVDYDPKPGEKVLTWMGGYYDARVSINPHWTADFKTLPEHPITRGVKPFAILDEWYYNMKFVENLKGVTPILKAVPPDATRKTADAAKHPGREEVVAWAYDRADGGRGFGFTGGHFHRNWADENFRKLVVNAILWSANIDVPESGAPVTLANDEIDRHLDRKRAAKPAQKVEMKP